MKINYFHISPIPSNNANAVQVTKTCSALSEIGVGINLYCLSGGKSAQEVAEIYEISGKVPINFWRIGSVPAISSTLFRVRSGVRMLLAEGVVYTREIGVAWVAGLLGKPFAYELHAVPHKPAQRWMAGRAMKAKSLRALISITRGVEKDFIEAFGPIPANRRAVVACGADLPKSRSPLSSVALKPGRLSVGYVGHLYPGKGAALIKSLAASLGHVDFHVVGKVEDPDLQGDVPHNVVLHGVRPHNAAMELLSAFDIVIAPYQHDASFSGVVLSSWFSPLKIFEYMSFGKAIVSSNLPVIREVLEDGVTALLVDPSDSSGWVEAIERLNVDEDLRQRLGDRARQLLEAEFTYERRAQKIVQALEP